MSVNMESFARVEINILNPELILNLISREGVLVRNVKRINIALISLDVNLDDLDYLKKIVKKNNGKLKVINIKGKNVFISRIKRRSSLIVGGILFLGILYFLSTYIWAIEILTEKKVSPYEIREILNDINVKQGIKKSKINVYDLEKELEDRSSEIVWARARIEGSTLVIKLEEKINPPKFLEKESGDIIAKMNGEVKRVYAKSGTILVSPGDFVKEGDRLIASYSGSEGNEFETVADGKVLANTFYQKEVDLQVEGERVERTGEKDEDIFITVLGKKIYLKKAINKFEDYDKIESNNKFINKVYYLEKKKKEIVIEKEIIIERAVKDLEKLVKKDLTNSAKIIKKDVDLTNLGEGKVRLSVQFVVEQNIAI